MRRTPVYARAMTTPSRLTGAVTALLAGMALTISGCSMPASDQVAAASSVPLVNTNWRLTLLGGQVVDNPDDARAVGLQLQAQNPQLTGFGGCNRMFGAYVLDGDMLKFDQVGSTKMACVDDTRMQLESRYFGALQQVSSWKITGSTLELRDADGKAVATFAAGAPAP
jgi:heat shock protein HslJ